MEKDQYYFPFKIINKDNLIPGESYYIKLDNRIIKNFLDKRRNLPVSHLKGEFVRLHIENDITNQIQFAVFKNVKILNQKYKLGLCNMMLVRYPEGILASDGCNTYSDINRTINEDREVFFLLTIGYLEKKLNKKF